MLAGEIVFRVCHGVLISRSRFPLFVISIMDGCRCRQCVTASRGNMYKQVYTITVRGTLLWGTSFCEACGLPVCRGTAQKLAVRFILCETECNWSIQTATDRTGWDSFYCSMLYFVTEYSVRIHSWNARCRKLDSRISSFEEGL